MPRECAAVASFGVRGVGSIYYVAFGLNHLGNTGDAPRIWAMVGLVIAMSVVVHGLTAKPVMHYVDVRRRECGTCQPE